MIDYTKELYEQKKEIAALIRKIKKEQKNYADIPRGKIRVSSSRGFTQYFFKEEGAEKSVYISANKKENIGKWIQREYEERGLKELERMEKELKRFLSNYNPKALEQLYNNLCKGRKIFIDPLEITDEMYVEKWFNEHEGEQNPFPEKGKFETDLGEFVRSKSEKIIADTLHKMNIPYKYEAKLTLAQNKIMYPDFTCLNVKKRKTVYWEHLGLLDNYDYSTKNFAKIETYENNGIYVGDTLLISIETTNNPLNVSVIRDKIEMFLM